MFFMGFFLLSLLLVFFYPCSTIEITQIHLTPDPYLKVAAEL